MSIYGEGAYEPRARDRSARASSSSAATGSRAAPAASSSSPVPTPETKEPSLASIYALTKYDQERMCLLYGAAYDVPTVALRFFNVYGPRQALSNPYTGALAIFAARLLNDRPPVVYEDGDQRRDFVQRRRRRPRLQARARARRRGRAAGERRQRPRAPPSSRSPTRSRAALDKQIEPELPRHVPRRRHPPLLR